MQELTGYHVTTAETADLILDEGFKGSKWTDDLDALRAMCSDPFSLYEDGAVWCYPSLEAAQENLEEGEAILEVTGEGYAIEHEAHGLCHVLKADTCEDPEII